MSAASRARRTRSDRSEGQEHQSRPGIGTGAVGRLGEREDSGPSRLGLGPGAEAEAARAGVLAFPEAAHRSGPDAGTALVLLALRAIRPGPSRPTRCTHASLLIHTQQQVTAQPPAHAAQTAAAIGTDNRSTRRS